jgi:hypothetical protein
MWQLDWTRRDRTNLYLIPPTRYQEQEFLTYQLLPSAVVVDWRKEFLANVRPTQRLLGLTVSGELNRIRRIGDSARRVFSIINTEYFLARFTEREREQFWLALWGDFPHIKGIIIFSALDTPTLLPDKLDLENWRNDGRLLALNNLSEGATHK